MGHTPGKWRSETNSHWGKLVNIESDKGSICFVSSLNEADARLIAAAPLLLEALKDAMHYAEQMKWDEHPFCAGGSYEKLMAIANSAIAAATGGE